MRNFYQNLTKLLLSTALILTVFINQSYGQVPDDYYDGISGTGYDLKTQLYELIKDHHEETYDDLWDDFTTTDRDYYYEDDASVMDMYSENPSGGDPYNYTYTSDQCGTYGDEGDCYNREHSFPKSWFDDASPMYTDLFHIYPTDGKVNGMRSNYPFGEVSNPTWTSQNGSKLGDNDVDGSGYTGTVFEPLDEFKGDFARSYFYMATRYEDVIAGWEKNDDNGDVVLDGTSDHVFEDWYLDLLMKWHNDDPVSQKELDRNDAVYDIQGNANPFINHPEWVCEIWGGSTCTVDPEPDNQPTDFVATAVSSSQIDLSWTDATGTNLPDGYLILANTSNSFTDPVDGTDPATDSDLSDGEGVVKVAQGSKGGYSFTGLDAETQYYFKIYSYANSGTNIDFKLDAAPEADAITLAASTGGSGCASGLIISEYGEGSSGNSKYIEIYNGTGADVDLSGYQLWSIANGGDWPENTYNFTTATISDGATLVIANNDTDVPGADEYTSFCAWNGDDAVALAKDNSGTFELYDAIGTDGDDPGSGWDVAGVTDGTKDHYLVRKSSITDPNTDWATSAGTSSSDSEWEVTSYDTGSAQAGHTMDCAASPTLSVSSSSLTGFTYVVGNGPSPEDNFVLSGSDLDGTDVTLSAPSDYEISETSGSGYTTSITFTSYDGSDKTIYVRLKEGLSVGTYNSETISISGGGDSDGESVTLDGEVTNVCSVTLGDNGTQVTAADVTVGTENHILSTFKLDVTDADATLTDADIYFDGSYDNDDIVASGMKLWFNTSDDFSTATNISSQTPAGSSGSGEMITFSSLNQTIAEATSGYFWVTADFATDATIDNTINVLSIDNTYLTFSDGNKSGSASAAGDQTIVDGPVTIYSGSFEDGDETWTYYDGGGTGDWERSDDGGTYSPGDLGHDGTFYAWYYGWNSDAEDWLISPAYDFSAYADVTMDFWSWSKNDANGTLTMKVSSDYSGDPTSATWVDYSPTFDDGSETWTPSGTIDLSAFDGISNVYIAFYYTGTDVDRNWAIDDYSFTGTFTSNTDETSEAVEPGTNGSTTQVASSSISSTITSTTNAQEVFNFEIVDNGGDGEITDVTKITIRNANPTNGADWTNNIQGVVLEKGGSEVSTSSVSITDTDITISLSSGSLTVAEGDYEEITLKVYLNNSNIEDGKKLQFMIDADNNGFSAVASTSRFASSFTADVISNKFTIDVAATQLLFVSNEPPAVGVVNQSITVTVYATDDNGNIDIDASNSITLSKNTGSGNMTSSTGLTQSLVSGTYTWNDVTFDVSDVYKIDATTSGLTDVTSNEITISDIFKFQGFDSAARDNWTYGESYTDSDGNVHVTSGGEVSTGNITTDSGLDITPENGDGSSLAGDGSSWKMIRSDVLVMDNVDLSNYTDVEFSFKYAGQDVNSGDELKLKVSYDGGNTWVKIEPYTDTSVYPEGGDFLADGYSGADWNFGDTNNPDSGPFYPENPFVLSIGDDVKQFIAEIYTGQYYYVDNIQLEGTYNPLTITTLNFMGATETTAIVNAFLENFGGETVTERGIVYGTSANPTTSENQIVDSGIGLGYYTADLSGLTSNTTYYTRAYVITDESGTIYGNELSFTTCDGVNPCMNNKDLTITEYIESSCGGTNNAIEIFNGTGCTVNLKHYRLQHDNAGSYDDYASTYDFYDFDLPNNQTFVISNSSSNADELQLKPAGQADVQDGVLSVSGDEQFQLLKTIDDYENYEVFEHVGYEANWGEEKTFSRNPDILEPRIQTGDGSATDLSCDPNTNGEWILYPDCYYDDLGYYRVAFDWEGDVSSDWFDVYNWNLERLPTRSATATISDVVTAGIGVFPEVTDDGTERIATAYKMNIEANSKVTIMPSGNMSITGSIDNTDGASGLIIKSDASGTGSLLLAGLDGVSTEATIERYVPGGRWSFIFSPLDNVDGSVITSNGEYVYTYDETTQDYWDGNGIYDTSGWVEGADNPLSLNKGYSLYTGSDRTYTFDTGELEVADKTFSITYTDHGAGTDAGSEDDDTSQWEEFDGWNLIGNPYTSAIDWNFVSDSWNKNNIENFVYYYDGTNYQCYGSSPYDQGITLSSDDTGTATQYIPAGQGFYVKASTSGDFTIPAAARVHNTQGFWKKQCSKSAYVTPNLLRLSIASNDFNDDIIVRTLPQESNVTKDHDGSYDAYKVFSLDKTKPQIFTKSTVSDNIFAVNSLPEFTEETIVPVGVYIGESGEYSINLVENNFDNMHIWLEDRDLELNTNLLNTTEYTFNQVAETNKDRFFIHFAKNNIPNVNVNIPNQTTNVNELYTYKVEDDVFVDTDFQDKLTLSASSADGSELPVWLSFNSETKQFSGTPTDIEVINVKVTATDVFGASTSEDYELTIKSATDIANLTENDISIYPNPANEFVTVELPFDKKSKISIVDITSKVLFETDSKLRKTKISLKNLSAGIYFIEVTFEDTSIRKKLIIN